ncbi:type I-G CRISPR-associated protein Csb2 [Azospirillum soli]|uniref:type I-G CRISPR-associated protein Csb2 n=1 Tax=Azospirillum soli TaxID=1304799 RepID=UPI001AE84F4E|nr:type I-U CRISPR-associated protein Csb2 [Azospirillum soli]MBP2310746.1 CRISPR-associated protein Csb2 [Azospirillum soli]
MPTGALLIEVRLLTGRYHGSGDWPPSPFRLFQALVAGAYGGRWAGEDRTDKDRADKDAAFRWLESLPPPLIAAPARRPGRAVVHYVPNNDLDAKAGDPRRTSEIRAPKRRQPSILEDDHPILYLWPVAEPSPHAARIAALAERLHTLGHGIDAASARAELTGWPAAEARLAAHGGAVFRPSGQLGGDGDPLCPVPGSLDSLHARHAARSCQFQAQGRGRNRVVEFRRPAKPDCAPVAYAAPPQRLLFDLRDAESAAFAPWPLARAAALTATARDAAAARLTRALPAESARVERLLVGHGAGEADKAQRPRILPLPSLGHAHTDPAIRRLLVEAPPGCPLDARDLAWAFTGLPLVIDGDGVVAAHLVPADDRSMLRHYGVTVSGLVSETGSRLWRTVTPVALPSPRPSGPIAGPISGTARAAAEAQAASALRQALRHAGIAAPVSALRVRRDPWSRHGERAGSFAEGTRFAAARLWHAEIRFAVPVAGPLAVGDGRYQGLGLFAPVAEQPPDRVDYAVAPDTRPAAAQAGVVVEALRRALMSLARDTGGGAVPTLFSGHETDSGPARSGRHRHLFLLAEDRDGDGRLDRLTAWAPWRVDRSWTPTAAERRDFARVTGALSVLRAGSAGVLRLTPLPAAPGAEDEADPAARVWVSRTPYRPTRHPKRKDAAASAIAEDLRLECRRRGLPDPEAEVTRFLTAPGGGLAVEARLTFAVAVRGPILLGRDAHAGGGLFVPDLP